jgi:NAD(P)-dependent dehydrogenase (short-subunit alcohol dehydrogenase family)
MVERRLGCIVNMASNVGIEPAPFGTAYSCSKAALLRLSDSLAVSVREHGIRVFAISPGWVWTQMTEEALEVMKENIPDFEGIPDSVTSPPEAAGELIVRLARGDADALSGRYIHVKDDLDAMLEDAERIVTEDLLGLRLAAWNPK